MTTTRRSRKASRRPGPRPGGHPPSVTGISLAFVATVAWTRKRFRLWTILTMLLTVAVVAAVAGGSQGHGPRPSEFGRMVYRQDLLDTPGFKRPIEVRCREALAVREARGEHFLLAPALAGCVDEHRVITE